MFTLRVGFLRSEVVKAGATTALPPRRPSLAHDHITLPNTKFTVCHSISEGKAARVQVCIKCREKHPKQEICDLNIFTQICRCVNLKQNIDHQSKVVGAETKMKVCVLL